LSTFGRVGQNDGMTEAAAIAAVVTGVLANVGGLQAWARIRSRPSLIAGVIVGDVLTIGGVLVFLGWPDGLWLAVAGAAALLGRFLPAWLKKPSRLWPGLVMALTGAVTLALSLGALLG
jgi:uncharacterized membrane protein (UPF0136 family)